MNDDFGHNEHESHVDLLSELNKENYDLSRRHLNDALQISKLRAALRRCALSMAEVGDVGSVRVEYWNEIQLEALNLSE